MKLAHDIQLSDHLIRQFCQKWNIEKLEIFGSILGDNFRPQSDIDFLATFRPGHTPGLSYSAMQRELEPYYTE